MTIGERNALIEFNLPFVKRLAGRIIRAGQRPTIDRDELIAVGLLSITRDLDRASLSTAFLLRNAKTVMIQHIEAEKRHWNHRRNWEEMFDDKGREKF